MLDKTKVSCMVKTHILSFMPPPLFAHLKELESASLKKRAKKGGVINDKKCVLDVQKLLLLCTLGKNLI